MCACEIHIILLVAKLASLINPNKNPKGLPKWLLASYSTKFVQKVKILPPCGYYFKKIHDLTLPRIGLKFNFHHLWKISMGLKMVLQTLKLGI